MMTGNAIIDKQRLYEQMYRVREIRKLQEEIDNISLALGSPGGVKLSDMPRSQKPFDKVTTLVSRKIEKEKKLDELMKIAKYEKMILEFIIDKISILPENPKGPMNSVLQDILRYRYIDDYPWKEIINLLCPDNDAFIDMTESNLRKLHKWNGQALVKFIKCQNYLSSIT